MSTWNPHSQCIHANSLQWGIKGAYLNDVPQPVKQVWRDAVGIESEELGMWVGGRAKSFFYGKVLARCRGL